MLHFPFRYKVRLRAAARMGMAAGSLVSVLILGCGGSSSGIASALRDQFVANGSKMADGTIVNVIAAITPDEAKAAALAARPGTATQADLGEENGVAAYDVRVVSEDGTKYDVKVHAATGTVFRIDADDNDAENNSENESEGETGETEHGEHGEQTED